MVAKYWLHAGLKAAISSQYLTSAALNNSSTEKSSAIRHTFKAYERLKREQHIDTLFRQGKAFSVFPLRVIYRLCPRAGELSPARAGFSVPKKKFRRAVQRNRIKRLLKECWRLQKHQLYEQVPAAGQLHLFFVYTDVREPDFAVTTEAMNRSIQRLNRELADHA